MSDREKRILDAAEAYRTVAAARTRLEEEITAAQVALRDMQKRHEELSASEQRARSRVLETIGWA